MSVSYYRIGRNIAAERNRAGLTQENMAEKMKISVSHYSNVERAKMRASIRFLVNACEVLDIPLSRLLHGAIGGIAIAEDESVAITQDKTMQRLSEIIDSCSEKTKENIFHICTLIAEIDHFN